MAFVRTKTVKGQTYHYLVQNEWQAGRVKQKVVCYLGEFRTVEAAHHHWKAEAHKHQDRESKQYAREMVKKLEPYL